MHRILPGLYTFSGLGMGRVYLIRDPDGFTLIDASIRGAADKIVAQIRRAGGSARDVRRILITHAHPDHVGGLPRLKELTGAEVICSEIERPVTEGTAPINRPAGAQLRGPLGRARAAALLPGTPVDRVVGEGDTLPEVMGGLRVLAVPGHAPGHLAFWQPERGVLFCGDVMMRVAGLRLPIAPFTADMAENRRSITRLAALDTRVLCLGHGVPLTQNAAATIRAFAAQEGRPL